MGRDVVKLVLPRLFSCQFTRALVQLLLLWNAVPLLQSSSLHISFGQHMDYYVGCRFWQL